MDAQADQSFHLAHMSFCWVFSALSHIIPESLGSLWGLTLEYTYSLTLLLVHEGKQLQIKFLLGAILLCSDKVLPFEVDETSDCVLFSILGTGKIYMSMQSTCCKDPIGADPPWQRVSTQISLIRVDSVCHSFSVFWHNCMVKL